MNSMENQNTLFPRYIEVSSRKDDHLKVNTFVKNELLNFIMFLPNAALYIPE